MKGGGVCVWGGGGVNPVKGHIRMKQNYFLPQPKIQIHSLMHTHSIVGDWRNLGKMNLNEPGRQKLGRYRKAL